MKHLPLQQQFEQVCAIALKQEHIIKTLRESLTQQARINTAVETKLLEQSAQTEALTQTVQELTRQVYG